MSIVSKDESTVHSPQPMAESESVELPMPLVHRPKWDEQPSKYDGHSEKEIACELLSAGWVAYYLGCALLISWLYYRNPGFWELVQRARTWVKWTCDLLR